MLAVDRLEKITIGGYDQWIRIRSRDRDRPVLLILYGGPGLPLFPRIPDFSERAGLEDIYTVAYWEQRGAGKSLSPALPEETMTIDRVVKDLFVVSTYLQAHFDKEQIGLLGESWGSVLGLLAAARAPDRFWGYVGMGQIVDPLEGDLHSFNFALSEARRRDNKKAIRALESLGPPPYSPKDLLRQRKWVGAFGGLRHNQDPMGILDFLQDVLTAEEYSWRDVWHIVSNPFFALDHLRGELYDVDLSDQVSRVDCPTYLLHGRHDQVAPASLARPYYETLETPRKEWIWFENSAHFPFLEEPDRFHETLQTVAPSISSPVPSPSPRS